MHLSRWTLIKALFSRKPANDLYAAGWAGGEAHTTHRIATHRATVNECRRMMGLPDATLDRGLVR